ncbi:MAG TPA: hypothetical protein VJA21_24295 [Verrucomicrobiae bacterium]
MNTPLTEAGSVALRPELLASRAQKDGRLLKDIFDGLDSDEARIKYGCAKALRLIAIRHPNRFYPHFDRFVQLLDHKNKILQWEGIIVLSYLAQVDVDDKFGPVFRKYFSPISGPVMITAANVIGGSARIARARPILADRIASEVLKAKTACYATPECRNVAIGHAITALGEMFDLLRSPAPVVRFVRSQLRNPRPATRKKAERLLNQIRKRVSQPGDARTKWRGQS